MSRWWRAYDEAVDDPKLQQLPDALFKAWFNVCCITSQNGGALPPIEAVAFKLRMKIDKARQVLALLSAAGLVDDDGNGNAAPHNWNGRQYQSDVTDPTNAERQRRYRKRHAVTDKTVTETVTSNVTLPVTVKRPDTDTEAETEKEKREEEPLRGSATNGKYAFESGVIRLTEEDLAKWKEAFSHLDLKAELLSLTEWAATQKRWFYAVSSALAKRNREMAVRVEARARSPVLTPAGNPWPEGIV